MHGLRAGLLAGIDDLLDDQIAFRRRRRTDMHGLVSHAHMQRAIIGIGIHRHRFDAELAAGLDDAASDLATVGDQDLVEQLGCHDTRHPYSGMLSCFFQGFSSFFSRSIASERAIR
jgi:hypothetical protein